jgi:transposase
MNDTITKTAGCDLGDRHSVICVLNEKGERIEETRVRTSPKGFTRFFEGVEPMLVVLEVGTHSAWVSQLLGGLGHETLVANSRRVELISKGPRKSDRVDAELLARLGRADPELLAPIRHREVKARRDLAVIRSRAMLVEVRSTLVTHVRGVIKSFGARLACSSPEAFPKRVREQLEGNDLALLVEHPLAVIESVNQQIRALDAQILQFCKQHNTDVLEQVVGVGPTTALTFVLTLEDKTRFKHSRDVGSYLGLVPRRSQSGVRDPALRISKTGDRYMRKLLISCAHYIFHRGPDTDLQRWAHRLAGRAKTHSKKQALVALARRLAILLHRLWVTGEVYQPLGYATARAA